MTMHFLFLKCCGIIYNIQENSTSPEIDIKRESITDGGESSFQPAE